MLLNLSLPQINCFNIERTDAITEWFEQGMLFTEIVESEA